MKTNLQLGSWTRTTLFGVALIWLLPTRVDAATTVPTPTFQPDGGVFTNVQDVVVSCALPGAVIHYTVNGRSPTSRDLVVGPGGAVRIAGTMTLRARAWVKGMTASRIKSARFETPLVWPYTLPPSLFTLPLTNHCIFFTGETVTISNSNHRAYKVYDLRNKVIVSVPTGSPIKLFGLTAGHYFIRSSKDRKAFAVISPASVGADIAGAELAFANSFSWQIYLRFKPQLWRVNAFWEFCEPADGVFKWSNATNPAASLDDNVDAAISAGASRVIVDSWRRPSWMEGTNNDALFIPKYTAFCQALAQHLTDKYSSRVGLGIEVWNEPHYETDGGMLPFLHDGKVATVMRSYLRVLASAHDAIKAVNPNIEVVAAAITEPPMDDMFTNFVAMGALEYMDGLGVTYKRCIPYEASRMVTNGSYWRDSQGIVQRELYVSPEDDFDTLCRKWVSDIRGRHLDLYEDALFGHSALGIPYYYDPHGEALSDHGITWWQGYIRAQKQVVISRAAGVSMLLNHVWEGSPNGEPTRPSSFAWEMAGWEYSPTWVPGGRGPSPKTSAWLAALARINHGTNFTNLHDSVRWVYAWSNPTNTTVVAWLREGAAAIAVSFGVTDVFGNPGAPRIGEEPMYWTTSTAPSEAAAAGFRALSGTLGSKSKSGG